MRPIFIVAEPEPDQALSVRKLVIETAKFNVITAHDVDELMESVQKFKNVNAVILHSGMGGGVNLEDTIKEIREVVG
ncbi:MAG TPA: hypothetical protein VM009_05180, partial [Terriglobales bacterium]|nr:hypothetical protein [Terriglobales bacterium]